MINEMWQLKWSVSLVKICALNAQAPTLLESPK